MGKWKGCASFSGDGLSRRRNLWNLRCSLFLGGENQTFSFIFCSAAKQQFLLLAVEGSGEFTLHFAMEFRHQWIPVT